MENLVKNLNSFLADLNVFYRKLQNYHWNVYGKNFFVFHSKLEEYYDEINEQIDEVAEHILMLNSIPLGSLKDYLENTGIAEAKNEKIDECLVIDNLVADFGVLLKKVSEIKKEADAKTAYATSSLMDNYISLYIKHLWMLNQTKAR